jgi:hypothetical protein
MQLLRGPLPADHGGPENASPFFNRLIRSQRRSHDEPYTSPPPPLHRHAGRQRRRSSHRHDVGRARDRETIPDRQQPASPNDQIQLRSSGLASRADASGAIRVPGVKRGHLRPGRRQIDRRKKRWSQDLFTTRDYREILNRPDIDAVIVATPDHWHRQIGVDALGKNKSVYLEKPMVQQLGEGEAVIAAQKTSKGILQVGSQGMSSLSNEKARELLASGAIGKLIMQRGSGAQQPVGRVACRFPRRVRGHWTGTGSWVTQRRRRWFFRWRNLILGTGVCGDFAPLLSLHFITGSMGLDDHGPAVCASGTMAATCPTSCSAFTITPPKANCPPSTSLSASTSSTAPARTAASASLVPKVRSHSPTASP